MTSPRRGSTRRRVSALVVAVGLLLGLVAVAPAHAAGWREYASGGRQWRENCEAYSSTVERCRTEIWATVATWNGRQFVTRNGWTFNNLLYKPSPREQWTGNPLATPGEHTIAGRKWRTECDTPWTGRNGCRSQILAKVPHFNGRSYSFQTKWVFNNVVQFSTGATTPTPPPLTPTPPPTPGPAPEPTPGATVSFGNVWHDATRDGVIYRNFAPIAANGRVTGSVKGTEVTVTLRDTTDKVWSTGTARTDATGAFTATLAAPFSGAARLVATLGPDHPPATRALTIRQTELSQSAPTQIDPLAATAIIGKLTPALGNVTVQATTIVDGKWTAVATARTASNGTYSIPWTHNAGVLGASQVRVQAVTAWGTTITSGATSTITRMRWPNTVITATTAAEVSATYRSGCPVGPANLRTIRINQQGMGGTVHRGEIIVRADLANKVADAFEQVFAAGFPVAQMRNPNVLGGSDTQMMTANNTSAFNCRRVVGNPSALSPHSYGKAVDFNPVQNPYRDPNGKWWPSSQYSVNRPASVPGLHTANSASVRAFKGHGFRWFEGWDWHHFEYPNAARSALALNPTSPAATSSGGLDERSLARPDGWQGDVRDGSLEEGFTGNGTWLHAVDPATKGTDVLAVGCADTTTDAPEPVAALEGNLGTGGQPGVSVAMEFATQDEAARYFDAWTAQKRACLGSTVTESGSTADTWLGQWDVDGELWSEAGGQRGAVVKLTLLKADLDATALEAITADF